MVDWQRAYAVLKTADKQWLEDHRDWRLPDKAPSPKELSLIIIEQFGQGRSDAEVTDFLEERGVSAEAATATIRMLETVLG